MITLPTHPRTGLLAVGWRKPRRHRGETELQPIWPVAGAEDGGGSGGDGGGSGGDGGQGGDGGSGGNGGGKPAGDQGGSSGNPPGDKGFPEGTPLEQMTVEQREAYWKHQARRHEDMWKAAGKSPSELKDLLAAEKRIKEAEEAAKSDLEKANDKATQAEQAAQQARQEALRYKIAAKNGISDEDADLFLTGTDEETVTKQAERYVALQGGNGGAGNGGGPKVPRSGTGEGSASGGSVAAGRELYKPRAKKE